MVPVRGRGQRRAGSGPERACAVVAVADALASEPRPAVIGEAIGTGALDDLAQDVRKIFVVVGAVDAGDVLVGGAVRLSRSVAREPVGMGLEKIPVGPVRVHPRHHEQPVVVRRLRQIAEEVAAVEERGAMMQRESAGIVSDDSPGVDDQRLRRGPLPVATPPLDVVAHRVFFGDVGLAPAIRPAVPRHGAGGRPRRTSLRSERSRHGRDCQRAGEAGAEEVTTADFGAVVGHLRFCPANATLAAGS